MTGAAAPKNLRVLLILMARAAENSGPRKKFCYLSKNFSGPENSPGKNRPLI
jgi:hypothetical protein